MPSQFGGVPVQRSPANQQIIDVFDPEAEEATPPKSKFGGVPVTGDSKFGGIPVDSGRGFMQSMKERAGEGVSQIKAAGAAPTLPEKGESGGEFARRAAAKDIPAGVAAPGKVAGGAMKVAAAPLGAAGETAERAAGKALGADPAKLEKAARDTGDVAENLIMVVPGGKKAPAMAAAKEEAAADLKLRLSTPEEMNVGKTKPGRHTYAIEDAKGYRGFIDIDHIKNGVARIGDVMVMDENGKTSNSLGTTTVRKLLGDIREKHPDIKEFSGFRASGARTGGEKTFGQKGSEVKIQLPKKPFASKIFSPDQPTASTKPVTSVEGVADKLYQNRGAVKADYKEFTNWAKQFKPVPQEFWQKALDHLDDPKGVPLSPQEKLIFDRSIGVLKNEIDANRAEIKAAGFDPKYLETESEGLGGAIRQRKGVGTPMDRLTGEKTTGRPPESGRTLSRSAGTFKSRNMMALTKNGKRQIVHVDPEGNIFDAGQKGEPVGSIDESGVVQGGGKLSEATRKEIEAATGGEVKYHDNAFGVYATSLLQTRRAVRSVRMLEEIKKSPEFNQVARAPFSKREVPKDWREIPGSPEFKGYKFEPRYAEEIEDFIRGTNADAGVTNKLDKINRFALNTLFWMNPIHAYNITDAFTVTKGLGGMARDLPGTTGDLLKSIKSVATRDKYNMQQARSGVPMPGLDNAGEEFRRMTLDVMGVKARQDPQGMAQFAKEFGFNKPADLTKRVSEISHKAVFSWQDVLQQTLERGYMRKGMTRAQATEEAAKTFMNYRTPARIADQRWMGKALQGQAWLDFPKYSYGRLKGAYNMAKGAAKGDPHALDQLLTIAVLYEFGQHVINPVIQEATGKSNAEFGNYGYTVLPELAEKITEGQRTPGQAMQSLGSPGYALQAIDLARGVNPFLGKGTSIPGESAKEVGFDYANEIANKVSPLQRMGQLSSGRMDADELWLQQLGVKFPGEVPRSVRRQLKSREKYGNTLQNMVGQ